MYFSAVSMIFETFIWLDGVFPHLLLVLPIPAFRYHFLPSAFKMESNGPAHRLGCPAEIKTTQRRNIDGTTTWRYRPGF